MKVAVLNFTGGYIEIANVPENIEKQMWEGNMDDVQAMLELGYDLENIQYMFIDGDPDDVLVYYKGDPIPVTAL